MRKIFKEEETFSAAHFELNVDRKIKYFISEEKSDHSDA